MLSLFLLSTRYVREFGRETSTMEYGGVTFKVIVDSDGSFQIGTGDPFQSSINLNTDSSITIPPSVVVEGEEHEITRINSFAFFSSKIKTITFSSKATFFGSHICENCVELEMADLSELIIFTLPQYMFCGCKKLEKVILPKLTAIDISALAGTAISYFDFSNIDSLDTQSFMGSALTEINLADNQIFEIPSEAFAHCKDLYSIILPRTLIRIGARAFAETNVKSIILPRELEEIGEGAFMTNINIEEVTWSQGTAQPTLNTLPARLFKGCEKLRIFDIPSQVSTIGDEAFYSTGITDVTFPLHLQQLGSSAFEGCISLTSANMSEIDIISIPPCCFKDCTTLSDVVLPKELKGIGNNAFDTTLISNIDFPSTLRTIEPGAFGSCQRVFEIDLSKTSIEEIADKAFYDLHSLHTLKLPLHLKRIGANGFTGCNIISITFPGTLEEIDTEAFFQCTYLSQVDLSKTSLRAINTRAFSQCSQLRIISFPSTLNFIGESAFENCDQLLMADLSGTNVSIIRRRAFSMCSSLMVILPPSIEEVGGYAMQGTQVNELDFPKSLNRLWDYALSMMNNLVVLDLSRTAVERIPLHCAEDCLSLVDVILPPNLTEIASCAFTRSSLVSIAFNNRLQTMTERVFYQCPYLEEADLSNTQVEWLSVRCFSECQSLRQIVFPSTLKTISEICFTNCPNLERIILPASLEELCKKAFTYTGIQAFDMSQTMYSMIRYGQFINCIRLKTVVFNEVCSVIGECAFYKSGIEEITLPFSVDTIYSRAFQDCLELRKADLSRTKVTEIGSQLFAGCVKLEEIILPMELLSIADSAFDQCYKLKAVYYCGENDLTDKPNPFKETSPHVVVSTSYPGSNFMKNEVEKREQCIEMPPPPTAAPTAPPDPTMAPTETPSRSPLPTRSRYVETPTPSPMRSPKPTSFVFPDDPTPTRSPKPTIDDGEDRSQLATIMWSAVGGASIFALTAIGVCVFFICKDRKKEETLLQSTTMSVDDMQSTVF